MLLVLNQHIDAVEGDTAVIADDSASAVGIGQAGEDSRFSGEAHFRGIGIENALIMRFAVFGKDFDDPGIDAVAVGIAGLLSHPDAAEGLKCALKRLIRLKADDFFEFFVQIAGAVRGNCRDDFGVHIEDAACSALQSRELSDLCPEFICCVSGALKEALVAVIGSEIPVNEISYIDGRTAPPSGCKVKLEE